MIELNEGKDARLLNPGDLVVGVLGDVDAEKKRLVVRLPFATETECFVSAEVSLVRPSFTYRQPGLLCTPRNFAQSSKFLGKKKYFWY